MWPPSEDAAEADFLRLFQRQLATAPTRAAALAAAQRITRYRPGRTHPAYWAGYRYYGRPSTP
jgi:CHAT domain-containing protein